MATRAPRRGQEIELLVERIDARGRGVGRLEGHTVRVSGAVPGQKVRARVQGRRRGSIEAARLAILEPGAGEVEPRCRHFASCGGCSLQELRYEVQLEHLRTLLERTLFPLSVGDVPVGGVPHVPPVIGCADPWAYRNKMDFTFSNRRWIEPGEPEDVAADFALGLHVTGRYEKVLDIERCEIAFPEASAILGTARRLARELELPPWDVKDHVGLLRHLVLRKGYATGEFMVNLVTAEEAPERIDPYARGIVDAHPEVSTFVQNVNTRRAAVAVGETERVLFGPGRIVEELAGLRFEISANSFFQTNTRQAERLLALVRERAACEGNEVVYDLCCGAGVLGLGLAGSAREVWGFELVPSAVEDARRNARINELGNARFVEGDLARTLHPDELAARGCPAPQVCVVDPPRAGLHAKAVAALRRLAPGRIVYVSCNPKSAVRDIAPLCADGYSVLHVDPIDLFPHTPHVECVFTLCRNRGPR
ncbi:MAG: 23S rRNA (uracil(1939)-C(5))-methyltransferase RlmD [Planctomycetota bacterium]|nr:23S rRNA (uracil(1939)-C(5))-methyltransferase RlmD [Planctomycetota bacterium]